MRRTDRKAAPRPALHRRLLARAVHPAGLSDERGIERAAHQQNHNKRRPVYGVVGTEAPAMAGEKVHVVGGANSAGQAALHLARHAAQVTLIVRGESLVAGMSDYLVGQLQATTNVEVVPRTRVVGGSGEDRLTTLTLEDSLTGRQEEVAATALFVLIGAEPHTGWLRGAVRLDDRGFILTGRDIPLEAWPLARAPLPFETSTPGVLAAGDVRHGSVKRVAGAVGEGSIAVGSILQYLAEGSGHCQPVINSCPNAVPTGPVAPRCRAGASSLHLQIPTW